MSEAFLYLTTTGRISGEPRHIEIWFVEHGGHYYMIAEGRESAHWVKNIAANPTVTFSVGTRDDNAAQRPPSRALGRALPGDEPLTAVVRGLFDRKYNWSDGLVVQLTPDAS